MRLIIFIIIYLQSLNAFSHSYESKLSSTQNYSVGRYSSVSTEPSQAQLDLLSVIIEIEFPRSIVTVGSALKNILLNSGYQLANSQFADPNLIILVNSPLPGVHRSLGPVSLRTALNTLSGTSWDLIVDPVHRLISFELIEDYSQSTDIQETSHD